MSIFERTAMETEPQLHFNTLLTPLASPSSSSPSSAPSSQLPSPTSANKAEKFATAQKHTIQWLLSHYQIVEGESYPKAEVYQEYLQFCSDGNLEPTTAPAFGKIIRLAFPNLQCRRKGPRGEAKHHYRNFSKRSRAKPILSMDSALPRSERIVPNSSLPIRKRSWEDTYSSSESEMRGPPLKECRRIVDDREAERQAPLKIEPLEPAFNDVPKYTVPPLRLALTSSGASSASSSSVSSPSSSVTSPISRDSFLPLIACASEEFRRDMNSASSSLSPSPSPSPHSPISAIREDDFLREKLKELRSMLAQDVAPSVPVLPPVSRILQDAHNMGDMQQAQQQFNQLRLSSPRPMSPPSLSHYIPTQPQPSLLHISLQQQQSPLQAYQQPSQHSRILGEYPIQDKHDGLQLSSSDGGIVTDIFAMRPPQSPVPISSSPSSLPTILAATPIPSSQIVHKRDAVPLVLRWIKSTYERIEGTDLASDLPKEEVYSNYKRFCKDYDIQYTNSATFGKLLRAVFPDLKTRRLGSRGNTKHHYNGIRLRNPPLPLDANLESPRPIFAASPGASDSYLSSSPVPSSPCTSASSTRPASPSPRAMNEATLSHAMSNRSSSPTVPILPSLSSSLSSVSPLSSPSSSFSMPYGSSPLSPRNMHTPIPRRMHNLTSKLETAPLPHLPFPALSPPPTSTLPFHQLPPLSLGPNSAYHQQGNMHTHTSHHHSHPLLPAIPPLAIGLINPFASTHERASDSGMHYHNSIKRDISHVG